ncbi:hypothetical protein AX774_g1954 [Zancudomyces culisetae]|uniref:Uncharacterized protein n=1 Tax=Zancudomyces culisetae TaxID=1213189 RepID=A0A1R1PQ50_ZANCU|nr:hypothetical protein AX774_g3431 [Zancudomyces culisetae]OMH84510.1 hypothetical protein AX774_g1954 [Zancudomyces culisetae]|eukprot:OMH83061.1 hypothetical protein AX774_g3431 [Zancudomyces culisetae]
MNRTLLRYTDYGEPHESYTNSDCINLFNEADDETAIQSLGTHSKSKRLSSVMSSASKNLNRQSSSYTGGEKEHNKTSSKNKTGSSISSGQGKLDANKILEEADPNVLLNYSMGKEVRNRSQSTVTSNQLDGGVVSGNAELDDGSSGLKLQKSITIDAQSLKKSENGPTILPGSSVDYPYRRQSSEPPVDGRMYMNSTMRSEGGYINDDGEVDIPGVLQLNNQAGVSYVNYQGMENGVDYMVNPVYGRGRDATSFYMQQHPQMPYYQPNVTGPGYVPVYLYDGVAQHSNMTGPMRYRRDSNYRAHLGQQYPNGYYGYNNNKGGYVGYNSNMYRNRNDQPQHSAQRRRDSSQPQMDMDVGEHVDGLSTAQGAASITSPLTQGYGQRASFSQNPLRRADMSEDAGSEFTMAGESNGRLVNQRNSTDFSKSPRINPASPTSVEGNPESNRYFDGIDSSQRVATANMDLAQKANNASQRSRPHRHSDAVRSNYTLSKDAASKNLNTSVNSDNLDLPSTDSTLRTEASGTKRKLSLVEMTTNSDYLITNSFDAAAEAGITSNSAGEVSCESNASYKTDTQLDVLDPETQKSPKNNIRNPVLDRLKAKARGAASLSMSSKTAANNGLKVNIKGLFSEKGSESQAQDRDNAQEAGPHTAALIEFAQSLPSPSTLCPDFYNQGGGFSPIPFGNTPIIESSAQDSFSWPMNNTNSKKN